VNITRTVGKKPRQKAN